MCDDNKRSPNATNGFGDCRQLPSTTVYDVTTIGSEESLEIINQQCKEIYELRTQLNLVMNERDMLLSEVGRLKFDMELYDQCMAR